MARRQHHPGPTDVGLGCFFGGLCSCSTLPKSAWGSHLSITFTGRPHTALSRRSSARSRMDFPGKERHGADIQSKCLQGHRGQLFRAATWFGPKHPVTCKKQEKGEGPARNPLLSAVPGSSHRDRERSEEHPGRPSQGLSCFGWRTSAPPDSCPLPKAPRAVWNQLPAPSPGEWRPCKPWPRGRGVSHRGCRKVAPTGQPAEGVGRGPPAVLRSGTFLPHAQRQPDGSTHAFNPTCFSGTSLLLKA